MIFETVISYITLHSYKFVYKHRTGSFIMFQQWTARRLVQVIDCAGTGKCDLAKMRLLIL